MFRYSQLSKKAPKWTLSLTRLRHVTMHTLRLRHAPPTLEAQPLSCRARRCLSPFPEALWTGVHAWYRRMIRTPSRPCTWNTRSSRLPKLIRRTTGQPLRRLACRSSRSRVVRDSGLRPTSPTCRCTPFTALHRPLCTTTCATTASRSSRGDSKMPVFNSIAHTITSTALHRRAGHASAARHHQVAQ